MSYQVLARKWRPKSFDELVGQKQTAKALTNALETQRLHHAYLFTGTRGVGKTTIARILSKSLNCDHGISASPCGECSSCVEIDQGNFVDLMEIDAASKTKVEDTRELLDNVQYRPTRGRYKVYLIDEVHMLSGHSFNALLKTLEEPPPHVIFLLATTDPQKLPVTVLSRCLQFHLKRMEEPQIVEHLSKILQSERIEFEVESLLPIAKGADGSMRDALSLLDQAIAYSGDSLTIESVLEMLGSIDQSYCFRILDSIENEDANELMAVIKELSQYSPDYFEVMAEWLSLLHRIAVTQATGDTSDPHLTELAARISPADLQLYYQLSLQAKKDLAYAPHPRQGFEMALLRVLAFRPDVNRRGLPSTLQSQEREQSKKKLNNSESKFQTQSEVNDNQTGDFSSDANTALKVEQAPLESKGKLQLVSNDSFKKTESIESYNGNNLTNRTSKELESATEALNTEEKYNGEKEVAPILSVITAENNQTFAEAPISNFNEVAESDVLTSEQVQNKRIPYSERRLYPNEKTVTIEQVRINNWHFLIDQMSLGGNGLQVLINSVGQYNEGQLLVQYLPKAEHFLTDNLQTSLIEEIRQHFDVSNLNVKFEMIESIDNSPKDRQIKLHQQALENAYRDLIANACVARLQEMIGATVDKETLKLK